MEIAVIGLNHKTAPIEVRERLAIPASKAADVLQKLGQKEIFDERLLLSTCNRTEFYGVGKNLDRHFESIKEFLSEYSDLKISDFESKLYVLSQPDSIKHLFSVASGVDSMVVGETEILGQVKDAYLFAHQHRQTGKFLNTLFQKSLKVAKQIRTETQIGAGHISVASVSVELALKIFGTLEKSKIIVLGTGEMATQVLKAMTAKGAFPIIVSSRHLDRAEQLAEELGGEAVSFNDYENRIKDADILIASTSASKSLIHELEVRNWMKIRHEKPFFMIDIAVPRNIDQACEKLDNVYLYNIDDLKQIADENLAMRHTQIEQCVERISLHTRNYMSWLQKEFERTHAA